MVNFKISFLRGKTSHSSIAAALSLLAVFASGCSNRTDTPPPPRDLGTVELRAGQAKSLSLEEGKEFWFLASPATNDEFLLDVTLNVRSFVGIVDKEKTKSAHVTAHSGSDCVVMLGTNAFKFTPQLAAP